MVLISLTILIIQNMSHTSYEPLNMKEMWVPILCWDTLFQKTKKHQKDQNLQAPIFPHGFASSRLTEEHRSEKPKENPNGW